MDTVAEIIAKHFHYARTEAESKKPITASALRDFGKQVAEAVRQECAEIALKANQNDVLPNLDIMLLDLDEFIK